MKRLHMKIEDMCNYFTPGNEARVSSSPLPLNFRKSLLTWTYDRCHSSRDCREQCCQD